MLTSRAVKMKSSRTTPGEGTPAILEEQVPDELLKTGHTHWLGALALFVCLVAAWEASVRLLNVSPHFMPTPSAIALEFVSLFDLLLQHLVVTMLEVYIGFGIAAATGIGLAVLVDSSRWLRAIIQPYILVLQATPKIALAPFIVIWFGFGMASKVATAAIISFFPIFINALAGFASINPRVIDLMTVLRASRTQTMWKAKVPHALPYVFAGFEIGILLSLIGAIVGEFVSATSGLGYLIANFNFQLKTAAAFAALVMLAAFGILSFGAIICIKRRIIFWLGKA
jgi:NitT/TauT family transport system permease protein